MRNNFEYCLRQVLRYEGGYSNDPRDPGGATNLGIIQREYDAYRHQKTLALQSVRLISLAEAQDIYQVQYWGACGLDKYPSGNDFAIFDAAVNNGVYAASKFAQRANNRINNNQLVVDGILGIVSHDLISSCDSAAFIDAFCDERLRYDKSLSIWKYFGKGWASRIMDVRNKAKGLIHG